MSSRASHCAIDVSSHAYDQRYSYRIIIPKTMLHHQQSPLRVTTMIFLIVHRLLFDIKLSDITMDLPLHTSVAASLGLYQHNTNEAFSTRGQTLLISPFLVIAKQAGLCGGRPAKFLDEGLPDKNT